MSVSKIKVSLDFGTSTMEVGTLEINAKESSIVEKAIDLKLKKFLKYNTLQISTVKN